MANIGYISGKAQEMMRNDRKRIKLFQDIDKMVELDWDLPEQMRELKWMRKVVSTDPLSAITVGRRTLATIEPRIFIQPLNDNIVTKKMANMNEQNLLLQLKQANKRAEFDIIGDVAESALRYGMTAVMTVPVKWQLKGTQADRWIANPGGYMVMVENPRNIYPRYSPLGLESVLHVKVMRAADAVSFYGDKAREIRDDIEGQTEEYNVILYDYWDYDKRCTWASGLTIHSDLPETVDTRYKIFDGEMDLPFLPWTVKKTGTSLSTTEDHRVRPTFAGIAHADMWELQNISKTFAFSEALGYAAAPRATIESYSEDTLTQKIDYGDINKPVALKPGEKYAPLNPPAIDQNLLHILDRTSNEMDRITGMKNLQNLDLPSGTAFATVNELIKAATSALDPPKELAQDTLGGVCGDMLRWAAHTEEDITALGNGDNINGDDAGRLYRLKWEHIQPDAIDVDVKLSAHVPTDRLQKINAAVLLNKELEFSKEDAYKELEVANPEDIVDRWEQERFNRTAVEGELALLQADYQSKVQSVLAQAQQQGGMNPQSMSNERRGNGGMPPTRTGAPRREAQSQAAQGIGFNPARGGLSPNVMNPRGFTKEGMTGVDRKGNVI